jgi:acyl-homoserine lactone acylase PvdQ
VTAFVIAGVLAGAPPDARAGFRAVLPPGVHGLTNAADLAAFEGLGRRPPHNDDQLAPYRDLLYATPGLTAARLRAFFDDSTLGSMPGGAASTERPRSDVTITRDGATGVPHIVGATREGLMFGAGYAAAEDRLFLMDALRHAGRAQLASFAGGAAGNRRMDEEQWAAAPYTEDDLRRQIDMLPVLYGDLGRQVVADGTSYVAGINAYIARARLDRALMPSEYAAIGRPQGPEDWTPSDVVATASLIGAIFGNGGGHELQAMSFMQAAQRRFGRRLGRRLWYQLSGYDDPDAPTTVRGRRFAYQLPPRHPAPGNEVLADAGTLRREPEVVGGVASGARLPALLAFPAASSNALLVSGRRSRSGRPLAVFGPQVGYFSPQILMDEELHGPGVDARGAAFPGVSQYVDLGHGRDFAWSATSAGQDIIDTFAVALCNPDGTRPTLGADHYLFRGHCLPFEVLVRTNSWQPTVADSTPAGSETLRVLRTKLGLVTARATVKGRPIAYVALRTTYRHEIDSAIGLLQFNQPRSVHDAASFQRAASRIGYTFNWFYVDARHIAYFNSGANPVRAPGTTGQLPMAASEEWRGFDPGTNTSRLTAFSAHPRAIDQTYLTSWNNRQAPGYAGADSNLYSAVYRSQMLDAQIRARLRGERKMTLPGLVDAMEQAATVDLRAMKDLPQALAIIGRPRKPVLARAVARLRAWVAAGAHRLDRNRDGHYAYGRAIAIMDAWWPRWLRAEFEPVLGRRLYRAIPYEQDNAPNNGGEHLGSAFQTGWYGWVWKDLRTVRRLHVRQRYARTFCGAGSLSRCRSVLLTSLRRALAHADPAELYRDPAVAGQCGSLDPQMCFDAIRFRPVGAVTQPLIPWQNRPTYQQAVEIRTRR